ncbi:hypothetical protein LPJ61_002959 [Coemansia biformis]|uniref:Tag1-like fifth Ig-like domain-containing protein n=1 Tax=Coemansia biformis TaxID=1286918 RepID=A0A9W7YDS6_9FUNG|nr:hypothetical protein LPJ61_002959 [Coemansia biformis]
MALARCVASRATRSVAVLLGACLAGACLVLGVYVLYIVRHAPAILDALRGSEPELGAVTLIDVSADAVLFAADIQFPRWGHRAAAIPSVNATVYHRGIAVGWLHATDLEVTPAQRRISLVDTFHITNPAAMEQLLMDAASSRRVAVGVHARVDLSGFGRYLPTASLRQELTVALPLPPKVNATVHDIAGPVEDVRRGGVTAQAYVHVENPLKLSANINAVRLDICYNNITVAAVEVGPASIHAGRSSRVPVTANIKKIANHLHEAALVEMVRKASAGEDFALTVSGSDPRHYDTAPLWLRRALHGMRFSIRSSASHLPRPSFQAIEDIVKDIAIYRMFAYWSAEDSYRPWVGFAGEATVALPNASAANVTLEVESLVPTLQLLDEEQRPFATVDMPASTIKVKQTAALQFAAMCDFERLGLSVVPGREHQYTRALRRAVEDRRAAFGVNGTLNVALATSIGRLRIDAIPFRTDVDWYFGPDSSATHANVRSEVRQGVDRTSTEVAVTRLHIVDTTPDLVAIDVGLAVSYPFSYGAFITDLALMVRYKGLHIATVGVARLSLSRGVNNATVNIDFSNHPADPRQREFFLEASAGRNITIEVAGFPNCTSILPLEASLRHFSQEVTVDMSKLGRASGSPGAVVVSLPQAVREIVFHVFSMSTEATIVNPVSGAGIWLQAIDAVAYYKGDIPLGTLQYDFTAAGPSRHTPRSSGLLLPYEHAATTPRIPIVANETSIGWDIVQRAIGGTLDVDVFTNVQVRIGNAQLNVTTVGRSAPMKIRF